MKSYRNPKLGRQKQAAGPKVAPKKRDSFEVNLGTEELEALTERLADEIQKALDAREMIIGDTQTLDQWHKLYEGGDRRITKNTPWPGAANLTSWIGTEKVDAIRSKVVQTIFTDLIWVVEGWGADAEKVPFVEQFHQWKAEEERLQGYISKVVHNSLIEGTGVLEVSERPVARKVRERKQVQFAARADGVLITDEKGQPVPLLDPNTGAPLPVLPGTSPELIGSVIVDRIGKVKGGPQYRVVSLKDFVILPGHASDRSDVWGYAKRFWKRVPELLTMQELGVYSNVAALGTEGEREMRAEHERESQNIAPQEGPTAEKELWEILFLNDLDGDGVEEWYVATLHIGKRVLLRLQHDDLGQARYVLFTPFPRPFFVYGYSLIGHKLETIIEEHTAWRNMIADRSHLVVNAPLKKVFGSIWNPKKEPWGPGRVMTVRDQRDVEAMVIPDVPSSAIQREGTVLSASERVAGLVDTALGVHPDQNRTLGEVNVVMSQSLGRVEEIVKHLHESMEDLFHLRHSIWVRTLIENPEPFPLGLQAALEGTGATLPNGNIDVNMLMGTFRGKPHGSVETADRAQLRNDTTAFLTAMTQFAQAIPAYAQILSDPHVVKVVLNQMMRVHKWENHNAINLALQKAMTQPPLPPKPPVGEPGGPAPQQEEVTEE